MRRFVLISLLLLCWSPEARAQGELDFQHQSVVVDVTGDQLSIDIELTAVVVSPLEDMAFFTPLLPIVDLTVNGEAVETYPYPGYEGYVDIMAIPSGLEEGDVVEIEARLAGEPQCSVSFYSYCRHSPEETFLIPSMAEGAWHFVSLVAYDAFVGDVTVIAPESHHVVAGEGSPKDMVENGDGTNTWSFTYDQPTENMFMYAAQATMISSEGDGFPVTAYFTDESTDIENVTRAVNISSEIIDLNNELYGALPVDEAHIMIMPREVPFGGMGLLGNVFVADYVLGEMDFLIDQGMGHEFGHSWWGGVASAVLPNEGSFIQNGFAEYTGLRALGELQGEHVRNNYVRMHAVWYMYSRPGDADIAVLDDLISESPTAVYVVYHKGSCVLRTFEAILGPETYTAALRGYLNRGFGGLTVAALLEEIEAAGGGDLSDEADQWLRQPGFPRLSISSQITGEAPHFTVEVDVESEGNFTYSLPLSLVMADGSVQVETMSVDVGESHQSFEIENLPVLIQADPAWTLVREVSPAVLGDVTLDGVVDALDLIEVALMSGGELPAERRMDGGYDPLYDIDGDRRIDAQDLDAVLAAAGQ